jgi:hypothetical protein
VSAAAPERLPEMLGRLKLGAIRDRLDTLPDEDEERRSSSARAQPGRCPAAAARGRGRAARGAADPDGDGHRQVPVRAHAGELRVRGAALARPQAGQRARHRPPCAAPGGARFANGAAEGGWVANGDALLLLGPPGVGKTRLAVGLGRAAIRLGCSVLLVPGEFQGHPTQLLIRLLNGVADLSGSAR